MKARAGIAADPYADCPAIWRFKFKGLFKGDMHVVCEINKPDRGRVDLVDRR